MGGILDAVGDLEALNEMAPFKVLLLLKKEARDSFIACIDKTSSSLVRRYLKLAEKGFDKGAFSAEYLEADQYVAMAVGSETAAQNAVVPKSDALALRISRDVSKAHPSLDESVVAGTVLMLIKKGITLEGMAVFVTTLLVTGSIERALTMLTASEATGASPPNP